MKIITRIWLLCLEAWLPGLKMAPPWDRFNREWSCDGEALPGLSLLGVLASSSLALTRHGAGQRVGEAAIGEPARVFWTRGSCGSAGPGSRQSQRWAEPGRAQLGCPRGAENWNTSWNHHPGLQGADTAAVPGWIPPAGALLGLPAGPEPAVAAAAKPRRRLGPLAPTPAVSLSHCPGRPRFSLWRERGGGGAGE